MRNLLPTTTAVPDLIGVSLKDSLQTLSTASLNARVVLFQENNGVSRELVIQQTPSPGTHAKRNQTIFLTIAHPSPPLCAPFLLRRTEEEVKEDLKQQGISYKIYYIFNSAPVGMCIAQFPSAGMPLAPHQSMIIYCSKQLISLVIMPSFINHSLEEALEFLGDENIKPQIVQVNPHRLATKANQLIIQQQPLAGTLIDRSKPISVQLLVS